MDDFNTNDGFSGQPVYNNPDTDVMTVGQWVVTLLIFMIPCVGIIMYFVWAFSSTGNHNRRNFCRAYLIIAAVIMLLSFILMATTSAIIMSAMSTFQ